MKKYLLLVYLMTALLWLSFPLCAVASEIDSVKILVRIDTLGRANITEIWDVNVSKGTEWYLVEGNMGDMEIKDLHVMDETGLQFETLRQWDINKSLQEKKGKCGIVTKGYDDYEICWGVGNYGSHTFLVSYTLTNFVKSFSDYDGFNHQFIARDLSSKVQYAVIAIIVDSVNMTAENTGIWAFGFNGDINFSDDGSVYATTSKAIPSDGHMTVMVRLDKGLIHPEYHLESTSFETMSEEAMIDSDYEENNDSWSWKDIFMNILSILLFFLFPLLPLFFVLIRKLLVKFGLIGCIPVFGSRYVKEWNRDIPFNGNLYSSYYVLCRSYKLKNQNAIIGAILLRWLQGNVITIESGTSEVHFNSQSDKDFKSDIEKELYNIMKKAAGKDGILQKKEFYRWGKNNYNQVSVLLKSMKEEGRKDLERMGYLSGRRFNSLGQKEARKVLGFKNYLHDFSLINERRPSEVTLWNDYLVYASLYGIAEEVAKQFKDIYPDYFAEKNASGYSSNETFLNISNQMSSSFINGASSGRSSAQRSSGGGGHSSFGGGGGHSGGGSGGGSR